jgi:hypothetical protein
MLPPELPKTKELAGVDANPIAVAGSASIPQMLVMSTPADLIVVATAIALPSPP